MAPTIPPISEAENAADKALDASPFCAKGNPSKTVAWLALEPGIPIKMDVKVSEVGMTATSPTKVASADTVSIPYRNGTIIERPAIPPKPGKAPMASPNITPSTKCRICWSVARFARADSRASTNIKPQC